MDTIQLLGSTLGFGFAAGIRLYATVLALGLAIRFDWYRLAPGQEHLRVLADPIVIAIAGLACLIEFASDKIPWVDSLWDSFHTIIRPVGAALLAVGALGSAEPATRVILVILCGGVAFASHSSKAATRLAVNHSPEPFSNIALSLFEDGLAPFAVWLAVNHPLAASLLVALFLAGFAWVAPKVFRIVRLELVALRTLIARPTRLVPRGPTPVRATPALKPDAAVAVSIVARNALPLPEREVRILTSKQAAGQSGPMVGIRCAAAKDIQGLRNSIGYLAIVNDELVFVVRRLFKYRLYRIGVTDIGSAEWKRGLLMHRLVLQTSTGKRTFYVFKDVDVSRVNTAGASARVAIGRGG